MQPEREDEKADAFRNSRQRNQNKSAPCSRPPTFPLPKSQSASDLPALHSTRSSSSQPLEAALGSSNGSDTHPGLFEGARKSLSESTFTHPPSSSSGSNDKRCPTAETAVATAAKPPCRGSGRSGATSLQAEFVRSVAYGIFAIIPSLPEFCVRSKSDAKSSQTPAQSCESHFAHLGRHPPARRTAVPG